MMTPDQILDRIRLKRQISNWRVLALFSILLLILALFFSKGKSSYHSSVIEPSHIARIRIDGVIQYDPYALEILKEIELNNAIKAVIVNIQSPGGTFVGGESLYNALRKISAKKPTVSVMWDAAASGGYMAAIATDYLIAHHGSITGSIGVFSESFEVTELANRVGINFYSFKSSPLKGGPNPTERLTPEMAESMNIVIKDLYNTFFDMVMSRRNISKDALTEIADGRAYTGSQALKIGLIDALGDEDTAILWLDKNKKISSNLEVIDYSLVKPHSAFEAPFILASSLFESIFKGIFLSQKTKFYS